MLEENKVDIYVLNIQEFIKEYKNNAFSPYEIERFKILEELVNTMAPLMLHFKLNESLSLTKTNDKIKIKKSKI